MLGVVEGLVVLDLVAGRLEEEGCGELAEVRRVRERGRTGERFV